MTISWHGHYTVKIITKNSTIIIDPHPKTARFSAFRGKGTIVALSNPSEPNMAYLDGIQGEPLLIDTPGEYSMDDISLQAIGWQTKDGTEQSLQRWRIEDMIVVHLGALNRPLDTIEIQKLEQTDIDIVLLPLGEDNNEKQQKEAIATLATLEPRMVIPIAYASVKEFAKSMDVSPTKAEAKVTITRRKLPEEGLETVILSP